VYPRAIAYSSVEDVFFVVDRVGRMQKLDRNGNYLLEWWLPQYASGKPTGMKVGPDGNLYVADTHYHRVVVFDPTGNEIRRWGQDGEGPGEFIFPTDIAFDEKGRIFVSEYGDNDRIQVFDPQGQFLFQFGKFGEEEGEFIRPQTMVIDGDTLYVTDSCNHRISVYTTEGKFLRNMGSLGSGEGQFRFPYGMAFDRDKNLVISEFGNNRVQAIDRHTGKSLWTWGDTGRQPGQLAYPWGIAVDAGNRVVVVDAGNNRLQVFRK
jgi:DNA-binding beta-propeller fold protein YncE